MTITQAIAYVSAALASGVVLLTLDALRDARKARIEERDDLDPEFD